jgi:DNA modification methylase
MKPTNRRLPLADLRAHPHNYNRHPPKQIKRIASSLRKFGQVRSIVVWQNTILAGHGVVDAARSMGWTDIAADVLPDEYPEHLALAYVAADNELARLGDPDQAALAAIIEQSRAIDAELLEAIGYDDAELAKLVREAGLDRNELEDAEPQIDRAEELRQKWGVESGQLWQLGEHRLICGDCTDAAVVERVMGGEKARLVFTSPPYADQREYTIGKFDWLALANNMFDALPMGNPCDVIINLGLSYKDGKINQYWQPWLEHCEAGGLPLYGWYVWDKGRGFPGEWNGRLAPSHEWLFHFSIGRKSANKWIDKAESSFERLKYKKTTQQRATDGKWRPPSSIEAMHQPTKIPDSVVRVWPDTKGVDDHPAIFPVELPMFVAKTWSDNDDLVYDPFSGSGTTLIACEQLGRRCRAVEIAPGYVAVALERWATATGKTPTLSG